MEEAARAVQAAPVSNMDETGWRQKNETMNTPLQGTLGSDRHILYSLYPLERRQVCLAHVDRAFELWSLFKEGEISRRKLRRRMARVQARMARVLDRGMVCGPLQTRRTCANLRRVLRAMFPFVRVEGVEPTNKASERALRPGVRWRRPGFAGPGHRRA